MNFGFDWLQFYIPPIFLILFGIAFVSLVVLKLIEQRLEMRSYERAIRVIDTAQGRTKEFRGWVDES